MPSCHVCGGEEFEEEDGLFYCSECQTQSQVMHSVELEETDGPMSVSMGTLREIGKKQKSREHSEHFKNEYEAGRPWSKYEAYQLIMQAQADALVTHGARPSIKDAILRLWAKYLSQLGVAFTDNIRLVPKALEKIPWNRELNRGDFEHPEVNPRRLKRNIRRSEYMTAIRHSQKDKDVLDAAAALEGETFYKGDNPFDAEDNGGDDSSHCSSSEVYSDSSDDDPDVPDESGKKQKLCCRALYNLPERMCLRKTLVFCYLGCLFTSPWITLSDIIRWASEGAIPYLETTHLLHDDMKLTAFDTYLFRPRSLTNSRLLLETSKLANYLAIQKLPPFPVKWLISRFIVALDLPVEMHALVVNLYARMPVNVAYRPGRPISSSVPNVDAVCMAYIFVMLKIIFGLNDFTERQLSLYTQKVQTSLGTDFHLFDWSLWQAHITRKFLVTTGLGLDGSQQSAMDVDGLCKVFHNAGYEDQTFSAIKLYNATRRKKDVKFNRENRQMLKRPLNTLLERWTQREERAARLRHQASHFLDSSSDDGEQTALGNEQNRGEGNAFFELLADERADLLKKSTLRHITEPDTFLHAALSKARERGCVEVPSGHVPARPVPSSSTRSSPRIKKSTSHTSSSTSSSSDVDRLLLSDLLSGHVCARDSYIIYPRLTTMQKAVPHVVEDSWEAKHYSYRWLLSLCHRLTYCSLSVVEKAVMEVEQRLIAHDFSQRMTEGVGESGNAEEVEADMSNRWQSTPKAPKHVHGISDSDCTVDRGGSTKRTGWSFGGKRSSGEDRRRGDEPASPSTRSAAKRRRSESTHVQTTLSVAEESATKKLKTQTNSSSSDVKRRKQASKQQDEDTRPDDNQSKSKKFARPTPTRPPDKRRLLPPRQTHSQQFSKDREITTDSDSSSGEEFMRTIRRRERLRHRQLRKHKAETLSPSARSAAKRRRSESTHVQTALSGAEESAAKRLKTQTDASSSDVKRRKQASKQQDEDTRPDDNQSKSKKSAHATPTRPLVKRRLPPPRQTHSQQFSKDREITTDSDSSSGEEFMRTVKRQERVRYTQRRKHKAKTLSA